MSYNMETFARRTSSQSVHTNCQENFSQQELFISGNSDNEIINVQFLKKRAGTNDILDTRPLLTSNSSVSPISKRGACIKAVFPITMKQKDLKFEDPLILPPLLIKGTVGTESGVLSKLGPKKNMHKKSSAPESVTKQRISSPVVIPVHSSSEIPNLKELDGTPASLYKNEVKKVDPSLETKTKEGIKNTKSKTQVGYASEKRLKKPAILPAVGTTVAMKLLTREKQPSKSAMLLDHRKQVSKESAESSSSSPGPNVREVDMMLNVPLISHLVATKLEEKSRNIVIELTVEDEKVAETLSDSDSVSNLDTHTEENLITNEEISTAAIIQSSDCSKISEEEMPEISPSEIDDLDSFHKSTVKPTQSNNLVCWHNKDTQDDKDVIGSLEVINDASNENMHKLDEQIRSTPDMRDDDNSVVCEKNTQSNNNLAEATYLAPLQSVATPEFIGNSSTIVEESNKQGDQTVCDALEKQERDQQHVIEQAWTDLLTPPEASFEDILHVRGQNVDFRNKTIISAVSKDGHSSSLSSSWIHKSSQNTAEPISQVSTKNIHFCCLTREFQLSGSLMNVGRKYHTPDRFPYVMPNQPYRFKVGELDSLMEDRNQSTEDSDMILGTGIAETKEHTQAFNTFTLLEKTQKTEVEPNLSISGEQIQVKADETRLYWHPAPPKLAMAPERVREILFPEYQHEELDEFEHLKVLRQMDERSDGIEAEEEISPEDKAALSRTVLKRHNSAENIAAFNRSKVQEPFEEISVKTPVDVTVQESSVSQQDITDDHQSSRRPQSAPLLSYDHRVFQVWHDFNATMNEIKEQKKLVVKAQVPLPSMSITQDVSSSQTEHVNLQGVEKNYDASEPKTAPPILMPTEEAIQAGRKYVILPKTKKKKMRRGKKLAEAKLDTIQKLLVEEAGRNLSRRESMPNLNPVMKRVLKVPWKIRSYRASLPDVLNFEEFKSSKRMLSSDNEREWVRRLWNKWFDLTFPPTPRDSNEEIVQFYEHISRDTKTQQDSILLLTESDTPSQDVTEIRPNLADVDGQKDYQLLVQEIDKLNEEEKRSSKLSTYDLCRRGALYRKIGQLKKAEMDLNRAIELQPELVSAYWHRHLLYLLQNRQAAALEDLKSILTRNKQHSGAYKSMAEIYNQQKDLTMAIVNYSLAIKFSPLDQEAYFQRGQVFEKSGEKMLAMDDYAQVMKLNPSRIDVIMKHGMFHFENGNFQSAVNDLTQLLKVDPLHVPAYLVRAQAFIKLKNWESGVTDCCTAIHLDPCCWQAFHMRACLLRRAQPKTAIQDFSISLLLNNKLENIESYLQRGILYYTLGRLNNAVTDLESCLRLNPNLAAVQVNIGVIFMTKYSNYHSAVQKFTHAIIIDPTFIKAYICRAEAYQKMGQLKKALKDFTRAIHLKPQAQDYHMHRGKLLLELGDVQLAALCIRYTSEFSLNSSPGSLENLAAQQTLVHSFLGNHSKAAEILEQETRSQPTADNFTLLGRTHMKAKKFDQAIPIFQQALDLLNSIKKGEKFLPETAEVHHLIGLCFMEIESYNEAVQQFNLAIQGDSTSATYFYQRGLALLKLRNNKGLQDLNKALALDPKMYQAYLSRACYYALTGSYAKAILNCNEAIKLQPSSLKAYLYRGSMKYHIKAFELAILDLTKAAAIDPQCPLAFFKRALCHQRMGQQNKAFTDYSIVLVLGDMLRLKTLINRGLLYFERQEYQHAAIDLKAAAKVDPKHLTVLHTLGICYHRLGQLKKAVKTLTRCVKLDAFFLDGFNSRANALLDFGNNLSLKQAKKDYQRMLHLTPTCLTARINLAYALQTSGKFMQAWKQFTTVIEAHSSYQPALEGRAIVNLQMNNTFGAYQDISRSINFGPTAELLTNRGVVSQFMGDVVMAMQDYQRAVQLDPGYFLAYYNAGNLYFHGKHFRQALDYYNKTLQLNIEDESAYVNRAITKVLLHDTEGALADFDQAVKLSPDSAHIYFNRANLYSSIQNFELAEKDYTKALELKPDDVFTLKRRADVLGRLGRPEDAIQDYKRAVDIQTRPHILIKHQ